MKYTHAPYDFTVDTLPISIGEFDRVLRNNHVDVGSVYEILAKILYNMSVFRSNKVWFSLVNVYCSHTGFSYGILPQPPKRAQPLSCTWYFTFAISTNGYSSDTVPFQASLRGLNAMSWGRDSSNQFLTIGTTHYQAEQLDIRYDMLSPQYLYCLLGPMTKNFALRNHFYTEDPDYSSLYKDRDIDMLRSQYYMMPMYNLVRNTPYHLWVFNRHVWQLGVKLLSVRHITAKSLMYVCQNMKVIAKLSPAVEAEVVDQFHESLTDMLQRQQNSELATEQWQLLYVALANRGKIPDTDSEFWLSQQEAVQEAPIGNYATHILKLLYS